MKVKDWMTKKVFSIPPTASVRRAFGLMKTRDIRHLPVVRRGQLVGIVTDRDLRRPKISDVFREWDRLYRLGEDIAVEDVMTSPVLTVRPETDLLTAASILVEKKIGILPVVAGKGKVVGVIANRDILKALVRELSGRELQDRKDAVLPA
ncbi:MAG TPA: CBS domain-containing protein [bacterium]|nr:CBS domain-containing protein [bacterium]